MNGKEREVSMGAFRHLLGKRAMCAVIFIAMPLLAYGGPPFKSTLIPCDEFCGGFVGFPGTEGFVAPGEPATLEGQAGVGSTGVLKVGVQGATPNVVYQVWMVTKEAGPFSLPSTLNTDGDGDGSVNNKLPTGTYPSAVHLLRDSDGNGSLDHRIQTGFVIQP